MFADRIDKAPILDIDAGEADLDGDTIKAVRELPLAVWVLFAIIAAGLAAIVVFHPAWIPEPYPNTRGWIILAAFILLPAVLLIGTWKIIRAAYFAMRPPMWWKVRRIKKRYARLFADQRSLLDNSYKTGKDSFQVNLETSELRTFKQLEEQGFICVHPSYVWYENMPVHCSLTPECSQALRDIHRMV